MFARAAARANSVRPTLDSITSLKGRNVSGKGRNRGTGWAEGRGETFGRV